MKKSLKKAWANLNKTMVISEIQRFCIDTLYQIKKKKNKNWQFNALMKPYEIVNSIETTVAK